jgi:hypothetical protein
VHFTQLQKELDSIIAAYPDAESIFSKTQKALKKVRSLEKKTDKAKLDSSLKADLLHKLEVKEEQLQALSFEASGLEADISADSSILVKGQKFNVKVTLRNKGTAALEKASAVVKLPEGWKSAGGGKAVSLAPGAAASFSFKAEVPKDAEYYHAYEEDGITALISYKSKGSDVELVKGLEETAAVLPDVGLTLSPEDIIVNTADVQEEIPVEVKVKNYRPGKADAAVTLKVPKGWAVSPKEAKVSFSKQAEEKAVQFTLSPPNDIKAGDFSIEASAKTGGKVFTSTIQEISYDHIGDFYYQYDAQVNGVAFELLKPEGLKVGYIDSGFDKVADYLTNAGFDITQLTEADLASGDLSQYDTIVVGIRAYLSREDLKANNGRLHKYVEDGGHLVVQYHKPNDGWDTETTAPFPLTIGNPSIEWRVTDEAAKVEILQPESPLFNYPNKITDADWDGWVQERGLYFPMKWDDQYETFVRMADPNEDPFDGGILMAKHGKGTYLYSSLVFYRQMQGQVPGGYRIFANLISYDAGQQK